MEKAINKGLNCNEVSLELDRALPIGETKLGWYSHLSNEIYNWVDKLGQGTVLFIAQDIVPILSFYSEIKKVEQPTGNNTTLGWLKGKYIVETTPFLNPGEMVCTNGVLTQKGYIKLI